ncbi:MAG: hypothetical protein EA353_14840 [Puniceicoccaceae bacterium]|nr:MAG: hypothetical protein EA353_14840 [Puniceicoccaceae bacterium]
MILGWGDECGTIILKNEHKTNKKSEINSFCLTSLSEGRNVLLMPQFALVTPRRMLSFVAALSFFLFPFQSIAEWSEHGEAFAVNQIVATQAIGGPYQFTDEHYLLEVARGIEEMGSNLIKFSLHGRRYTQRPYRLPRVRGVSSMKDLLTKHPVFIELMEMDFRFYHIWAKAHVQVNWKNGVSRAEGRALYREFYEFTEYLLREYKGTGKVFFLGHWEGDWLLTDTNPNIDPTPERIRGFAQYLNIRQAAITAAREANPDQDVWVYHYTEVNQVWKGIEGERATLTNSVLPLVDVDYVSYSSYDVIHKPNMREALFKALDHIESQLKPRDDIKGKRVFVGEYAIKAASVNHDPVEHDRRNREVTAAILEWGCPFAIYWQYYCNEPLRDASGYEGYWLVDDQQNKVPLYHTFQNYYAGLSDFVTSAIQETGDPPSAERVREHALEYFQAD